MMLIAVCIFTSLMLVLMFMATCLALDNKIKDGVARKPERWACLITFLCVWTCCTYGLYHMIIN